MANELNIALKSGLTVTAQPYQSGSAVGSAISCPETGSTGFYSGNMAGAAGTYQLVFRAAGANVGSGSIVWNGTAEVASSAPTAVQIRQEMDSNSTKLANLDATVSSRLAPSGTLATVTTLTNAPESVTPAQIRAELDANSIKLANLDASVSSRLAASSYTAPTTPPTAAQNASATRTELATELGRIDAGISSRLASSAYTAPANSDIASIKAKTDALPASPAATGDIPTESEIAAEVWAKPTTELTITGSIGERAKNQSTVSTTGAQLAAALS